MSNFIEELKTKSDLVSIVSRYVPLERKGHSFWGRCPFHSEKTPSFAVNEYDQFYHCFGCGAGGDVIKFIMDIESVDFMGAVHFLADLAHMEVPSFSSGDSNEDDIKKRKQEKDRLLALMKDTARHYVDNLSTPQAKAGQMYLAKRGVDAHLARAFGIGMSLGFTEIIDFLKSKGYTIGEMEKVGIVKLKDGRPYDAIGGRVVFPIIDTSNNVIAFCGRTLDPKPEFAKYINTSDTVLFSKSKNLYGINLVKKAKLASGKLDPLIVVEGQMDVVSLHKAGFGTAVASMGTALTQEQAKLIKRFSDKVFICYDGDTAGKKATLRGLDILKNNGLDVYVMSMPEGLDPDDVINKYGAEGYKKLQNRALPLVDFKLEFLKKQHNTTTSEGKTKFLNEAIGVLRGLSEVEREVYIDKVSEISGVMKDFIKRQVDKKGEIVSLENPLKPLNFGGEPVSKEKVEPDSRSVQAEKYILSAMVHQKPYAFFNKDISKYFTNDRVEFYKKIVELGGKFNGKELANQFYAAYVDVDSGDGSKKDEQASEIINYIYKNIDEQNDMGYFKDCAFVIKSAYCEREVERLTRLLDTEVEKDKRMQIMTEIKNILEQSKNRGDL